MKKITAVTIAIILLSFAMSIYIYPMMPAKLASHWDINGNVNGYMSKFWGLFFTPILSIILFAVFTAIPLIDPLKKNIAKFKKQYDTFIFIIILFIFYIHVLLLFWNFGFKFNMIQLMSPAFAILFYYMGNLISKSKRNWFIGIRTPWTLSSDYVWKKTHELGGKLIKVAGIISLAGIFLPQYEILFIIIPIITFMLFSVIYSYIIYSKEKKRR